MSESASPENKPRTVLRLEVDSYQRMRVASLEPSPTGLVLVRGRNAQGKSSLLGSMLDALGVDSSQLPIQEGQHMAQVVMHLGDDLVLRKRWSRDAAGDAKAALTIEAADGSKVRGPAGVLKELRGLFADPVAFLEQKPDEQVRTVLHVLGLDTQLHELEELAKGHYERRRDLGREADRITKAAAELRAQIPIRAPSGDAVTIDQLTERLQQAQEHNSALDAVAAKVAALDSRGRALMARCRAIDEQIAELSAEKARLVPEGEAALAEWKLCTAELRGKEKLDLEPFRQALREHDERARYQAKAEQLKQVEADAEKAKFAHHECEEQLAESRKNIQALLASAKFPVDGMTYDPERKMLLIGGIPFGQASQAERLKAAAAVAMAGSQSIRVLFAREGSLLDEESRLQLAHIAESSGYQLWLEVVDSNPDGAGIWIEDGEATQA